MRRTQFLFAIACLCATCPGSGQSQDSVPAASHLALELQQRCEQYRLDHWGDGTIEFEMVDGASTGKSRTLAYKIAFHRDCLKLWRSENGGPPVQAAACDGRYTWAPGPGQAVTVAPVSEYADVNAQFGLFHPRWIGLSYNRPSGSDRGRTSRCLLIDRPPSFVIVEDDTVDGVAAKRITYRIEGALMQRGGEAAPPANGSPPPEVTPENRIAITEVRWIVPDQGYSLIRSRSEKQLPGRPTPTVDEINARYEQEPVSGVWFPRTVSRRLTVGTRVVDSFDVTVQDISFRPVESSEFTIEHFGLPKNVTLLDRTAGPQQLKGFWDGERAVWLPSSTGTPHRTVPEDVGKQRLLLWINGGLLLIAGCALVIYWVRARSRSSPPGQAGASE